jgi:DNA invertase Pin-like site-specific DNA recombinase
MPQAIQMITEKALSYYRFSDPKQARGRSKGRQEDLAAKYAADNNFEIVETFKDEGRSAFRGDNATKGSFAKIIHLAENQILQNEGVKHILIEGFDRMSRMSADEALALLLRIIHTGMTIHTLLDRRVYTRQTVKDPMYLMGSIMIMARAHEESLTKSKRLKDAREANRLKARAGSEPMTPVCPFWLEPTDSYEQDGKSYKFRPDEDRRKVIVYIYELAADGHSIYYITRKLTEEGVPTFRTGKGAAKNGWSTTYISKLLKTEAVLGTMQPRKLDENGKFVPEGDPILNYYPPIIDVDLYNRAQITKRPRNTTTGATGKTYTNLFKELLHCAHCSSAEGQVTMQVRGMGMGRNRKKAYHYLICAAKRKTARHPSKRNFRYDEFERLFLEHVQDFDVSRIGSIRSAVSAVDTLRSQIADTEYGLKNLKNEVESLGKQLDNASDRVMQFITDRLDKKLIEMDGIEMTLKTLNDEYRKSQSKEKRRNHSIDAIAQLKAEMANATGHELYEIRSRLAMAIQSVVTDIRFDAETGNIDVIILDGIRGYRFNGGKLAGSFNLIPQIASGQIPAEAYTSDGQDWRDGNNRSKVVEVGSKRTHLSRLSGT